MDCFSSWHCQSSVDQSLGWGVIYYTVSTPQPGSSENVNCFQLGMFHHTDCRSQRMLQYVLTAAFLVFQPFNISETDQITQDCAQSVQCGLMLNILSILLTKIYMLQYNSGQLWLKLRQYHLIIVTGVMLVMTGAAAADIIHVFNEKLGSLWLPEDWEKKSDGWAELVCGEWSSLACVLILTGNSSIAG